MLTVTADRREAVGTLRQGNELVERVMELSGALSTWFRCPLHPRYCPGLPAVRQVGRFLPQLPLADLLGP